MVISYKQVLDCLDYVHQCGSDLHKDYWAWDQTVENPFKKFDFKDKQQWKNVKQKWFLVTPDLFGVVSQSQKASQMYGDAEVFDSVGDIPKLYPNAPEGQSIFQKKKVSFQFCPNNHPHSAL